MPKWTGGGVGFLIFFSKRQNSVMCRVNIHPKNFIASCPWIGLVLAGIMHPDLLNNPTFLRYHEIWQRDPESIVFAPLADFFCQHKLYADARKVCEEGVRHHPHSVLAHYSLARSYLHTREWHSARHEAQWVLARVANHEGALDVLRQIDRHQVPVRHIVVQPVSVPAKTATEEIAKVVEKAGGAIVATPEKTPSSPRKTSRRPMPWMTVTMAKIYSQQGLYFKARTIYKTILSRDPQNTEAKSGLATLQRVMRDAAA